MVVVVGDVSCSVLLLAVVCCDGPLRGGLAGGRVEDSKSPPFRAMHAALSLPQLALNAPSRCCRTVSARV